MQTRSRVVIGAIALVVASVMTVAGCGGDDDDDPSEASASPESGEIDADEVEEYVGLTEAEAGEKADEAGTPWRVIVREGEALPATMDYRPDRLNFTIEGGEVTLVTTG